ncbi:hypothetical protein K402DRAFT_447841 [Aulographum hederae CBS 113979]|uniref:Uncharacterized protein n=1 Tax=Aulographum hederae CBS 113979 TaxID=1176131 RepID=A0A6G1GT10_9PEZI|nr:hypothetical protein K402DRAFT_447841 [Aulographum hederae CBS 113979]
MISRLSTKSPKKKTIKASMGRKKSIKSVIHAENNPEENSVTEDLTEFIERPKKIPEVATKIFTSFPPELRTLSYTLFENSPYLQEMYSVPIPGSTIDILTTHLPPSATDSLTRYLFPSDLSSLPTFLTTLTTPLLDPRYLLRPTHPPPQALNNVAWLCRACHSFVHAMAGNEELASEWYTLERIEGREDVRRWVGWVGRVRWKKR